MAYEGTQIDSDGKRRKVADGPQVEPEYEDIPKDDPKAERPTEKPEGPAKDESPKGDEAKDEGDEGSRDDGDDFPRHVGGGTYELRSGARVKGKTEALEAQIEEDEGE